MNTTTKPSTVFFDLAIFSIAVSSMMLEVINNGTTSTQFRLKLGSCRAKAGACLALRDLPPPLLSTEAPTYAKLMSIAEPLAREILAVNESSALEDLVRDKGRIERIMSAASAILRYMPEVVSAYLRTTDFYRTTAPVMGSAFDENDTGHLHIKFRRFWEATQHGIEQGEAEKTKRGMMFHFFVMGAEAMLNEVVEMLIGDETGVATGRMLKESADEVARIKKNMQAGAVDASDAMIRSLLSAKAAQQ